MSKAMPFQVIFSTGCHRPRYHIQCDYSNYRCYRIGTVVSVLRLDSKSEVRLVILACYSIGMGAVLTPIGEPLSTIATSKLNEDFFYLLQLIGADVIPGVIVFGILAAIMIKPRKKQTVFKSNQGTESYIEIINPGR